MQSISQVKVIKNDGQMKRQRIKTWGFYLSVVALPLLQFCIFYIGVNFNSFFMAFQEYEVGTMNVIGWNFENFKWLYNEWANFSVLKSALKNSLTAFGFNVLVGMTCGILFSYYIFKKMPMSQLFKVLLFMPSIVSSMVMTMSYQYFVTTGFETIMVEWFNVEGFTSQMFGPDKAFGTIVFYCIWASFGTQILMYVGAMSDISEGTLEAGKIDGANALREFWHIVLPSVWPTFVVFLTTQLAAVFTNQMSLMNFNLGADAPRTVGFYIFENVERISRKSGDYNQLTRFAALGILCSLIALPITLSVRWALTKFGPSDQ